MIYKVTIVAPAINEAVTLSADSEAQAKKLAVTSSLQRQANATTVTVKAMPDGMPTSE